ncbi:peptidoglycan DD-metalloendopeptidase family protein [Candidatus Parcubacteria bacterium]|nr:peptidoglycan DD-metalloendopeptidase family protein [Candidatus Parcubacteria bacterium]
MPQGFKIRQFDINSKFENRNSKLRHWFVGVISALLVIVPISIFVHSEVVNAALIDDLRRQIDEKSTDIKRLEEEARKYQGEIKESQLEQATLAGQIARIVRHIAKLSVDIQLTEARIVKTESQIEQLGLEIQNRVNEIEGEKRTLAQAIRVLSAYDGEAALGLVLKHPTFSDFLDQMQYLTTVQGEVQGRLSGIKILKARIEEEKTDLEGKREELGDLRGDLGVQQQLSRDQRLERENLLKQTRSQETRYQALLKDLRKRQIDIEQEIISLEDKLRRAINPSAIPAARPGVLAWPLEGALTQLYGPKSKPTFNSDFHNGIDIAAPFGAPVRAAEDGTVAGVGDLGRLAYGRWAAIRHDNGLTTLYAHLSLAAAQPGQAVKRGDIIGYEGSTGFSTGPHLHFVVYASDTFRLAEKPYGVMPIGGTINPMDYLP